VRKIWRIRKELRGDSHWRFTCIGVLLVPPPIIQVADSGKDAGESAGSLDRSTID